MDILKDRQIDKQTDKLIDKKKTNWRCDCSLNRINVFNVYIDIERQKDREILRKRKDRQKERKIGGQKDRKKERQIDRYTNG